MLCSVVTCYQDVLYVVQCVDYFLEWTYVCSVFTCYQELLHVCSVVTCYQELLHVVQCCYVLSRVIT